MAENAPLKKRKSIATKEESLLAYRAGQRPVLATSIYQQNLRVWTDLLASGEAEEVKFKSGQTILSTKLSSAKSSSQGGKLSFGRCTSVMAKLDRTHTEKIENLSDREPTNPEMLSGTIILDTGVLLLLQISPHLVSDAWKSKLAQSRVIYSSSAIGEIQNWLNGDDVIRDTIRRYDFIELLTEGCFEVPIDTNIISEAMTLRGDFDGDINDRILIATARLHQATIITKNQLILDYPFAHSTNI